MSIEEKKWIKCICRNVIECHRPLNWDTGYFHMGRFFTKLITTIKSKSITMNVWNLHREKATYFLFLNVRLVVLCNNELESSPWNVQSRVKQWTVVVLLEPIVNANLFALHKACAECGLTLFCQSYMLKLSSGFLKSPFPHLAQMLCPSSFSLFSLNTVHQLEGWCHF